MELARDESIDAAIESLIRGKQYTLTRAEKEQRLFDCVREQVEKNRALCPAYDRFLRGFGFEVRDATGLSDFPPLPVVAFKHFDLRTCAEGDVVRVLNSSGTTQQRPSRVPLDRTTLHRQSRSLMAIVRDFFGAARRPYLVLDVPETNAANLTTLGARGAAIRGLANAASKIVYGVKLEGGEPALDWEAIDRFCAEHAGQPVLVSGLTFFIWRHVIPALERRGRSLGLAGADVLHGGGWKTLQAERVSKEAFSERTAAVIGCSASRVCDYYAMVEQVGIIFPDCAAGNKHAPNFATVLLCNPLTMAPVAVGEEGLIEVVSALPSSYPGQLVLTEDQGVLVSVDDCTCGRKDVAFRFTARVEGAELRGCGDTLAAATARGGRR